MTGISGTTRGWRWHLARRLWAHPRGVLVILACTASGVALLCGSRRTWSRASVTFQVALADVAAPADRLPLAGLTLRAVTQSSMVLARALLVFESPDSQAVRQWRAARQAWRADPSPARWRQLEACLWELDAAIAQAHGQALRDELRTLAGRIRVEPIGPRDNGLPDGFCVTVTWPTSIEDARRIAELFTVSCQDRYRQVQIQAGWEAADLMRDAGRMELAEKEITRTRNKSRRNDN